tara:strand:- start:15028 stop:15873 length:846 start_codon:yes stop_codon:yes gene_type:complete
MNNLLVTGANGQLGSEIKLIAPNYPQYNFFFTDAEDLDITKHEIVKDYIKSHNINIIINCAAYTAVDNAEYEPEISNEINHLAVSNFAKLAVEFKIKLIHISTDYVFDGENNKPYRETDITNPQSVYGKTKLDGELALQKINPQNSIIIRTSWVYSRFGKNFVKTMLQLAESNNEISVVNDQTGSPTNAADLSLAILTVIPQINNKSVKLFHYSNSGSCTWYDFAKAIFENKQISIKLKSLVSKNYPTKASRPKYSVLNSYKFEKEFDIKIRNWKNSLKSF